MFLAVATNLLHKIEFHTDGAPAPFLLLTLSRNKMTELNSNAVMALSPDATMRTVDEGAVILMVKTGQLYSCNETAQDFISRLDGTQSIQTVAETLSQEYDVSPEELKTDLSELLSYLLSEGVLISVN